MYRGHLLIIQIKDITMKEWPQNSISYFLSIWPLNYALYMYVYWQLIYYYYAVRDDPVQQATPDTVTGIYLVIQLAIIASGLC